MKICSYDLTCWLFLVEFVQWGAGDRDPCKDGAHSGRKGEKHLVQRVQLQLILTHEAREMFGFNIFTWISNEKWNDFVKGNNGTCWLEGSCRVSEAMTSSTCSSRSVVLSPLALHLQHVSLFQNKSFHDLCSHQCCRGPLTSHSYRSGVFVRRKH